MKALKAAGTIITSTADVAVGAAEASVGLTKALGLGTQILQSELLVTLGESVSEKGEMLEVGVKASARLKELMG